jgi:hypothetical protein
VNASPSVALGVANSAYKDSTKEASPSVLRQALNEDTVGSPSTGLNTRQKHFEQIKK